MSQRKTENWLTAIILGIGLIPSTFLGIWLFMGATAIPLHPNPHDAPSAADSAPPSKWARAVEESQRIVRSALTQQNLPGLSAAVGVGGDVVWAEGFGWADLEKRNPVAPDTTFRIGTASTAVTSAAAGVLIEEGLLQLDDAIQKYVPGLPQKQWPVTLRQLMGHIAGVANDGGDEGPLFGRRCEKPADALQFLSSHELELLFAPGTQYRYSSYGWILVSAAIEAAADEPFLTFMQKEIFEPAGMRHTKAESAGEQVANRATSYFPRFAADPRYGLHLMRPLDYSCYAGSSAFLSTPTDLVRFGIAMSSGKLLQPATVNLLQSSQRLSSGEETGYGLGWDLENVALAGRQTQWVGHVGTSLGGTVAALMMFPEHGIVVSLISNIPYADTEAVSLQIANAFAAAQEEISQRYPKSGGKTTTTSDAQIAYTGR